MMPVDFAPLMRQRAVTYDGLKACFLDASGAVLVDGKPAADATAGTCTILNLDAHAGASPAIEFKGPLQVVTVVATDRYLKKS